jgi:hypothetical protein
VVGFGAKMRNMLSKLRDVLDIKYNMENDNGGFFFLTPKYEFIRYNFLDTMPLEISKKATIKNLCLSMLHARTVLQNFNTHFGKEYEQFVRDSGGVRRC